MATQEPLTPDIEAGNGDVLAAAGVTLPPEPEFKGPLKPVAETTPIERVAGIIAGAAIITALVAMIIEHSAIVVVAGILSIMMGPYAYYQQTRLTDIITLKETAAVVQVEVERLESENNRLTQSIDELGNTIDDLQDVEEALDVITKTQGQSVNALLKQVEENKDILSKMKKSTKGQVIQNLISIIYRGDEDANDIISDEEATKVIAGLKRIGGLKIHEDRLRNAMSGKSIDAIIEVVKNLIGSDVPESERIFEVDE